MSKIDKKYLLTQISAIFVAVVVSLIYAVVNRKVLHLNNPLFFVGYVILLPSTLTILGKLFVWLKILSKEEAKGYPFSKPWENIDKKN